MTAKELKASILQLAVTGKLVPQDPNDEPASVLLERIKVEKAKLVKAGKIKKDKNPSEIVTGSDGAVYEKFKDGTVKDISDELPFKIPGGWAWVRLGDVCEIQLGKMLDKAKNKGTPYPYLANLSVRWRSFDLSVLRTMPFADSEIEKYSLHVGDILMCEGGVPGRCAIWRESNSNIKFQKAVHRLRPTKILLSGFVQLYFETIHGTPFFCDRFTGTTIKHLPREILLALPFPLPSLAEQKRIVAKIEKLMPLVEEYGKMEETRLQLDADLPATLEKSILQEAIQGKLVPQDPNDEPASELLKRIAAERKALVKAGKLKRDKSETVIFRGSDRLAYETRNGETVCIQDEIPFEIPDSWEWVRLGDMSNYGQCTSVDTADIDPGTWSLDLEEIEKGTGRLIERKTAADKKSKSSKHVFTKGTLLYSKLRTYLNKVLVADMDGVCTSEIVPIELNGGVNAEYVRLVLMSPYFLEYTTSKGYGIKMPRVGTDDMKRSLIPLPPLDEQKRIVKRVEELKGTARTLVTF